MSILSSLFDLLVQALPFVIGGLLVVLLLSVLDGVRGGKNDPDSEDGPESKD